MNDILQFTFEETVLHQRPGEKIVGSGFSEVEAGNGTPFNERILLKATIGAHESESSDVDEVIEGTWNDDAIQSTSFKWILENEQEFFARSDFLLTQTNDHFSFGEPGRMPI